jgi:hypothetical protein
MKRKSTRGEFSSSNFKSLHAPNPKLAQYLRDLTAGGGVLTADLTASIAAGGVEINDFFEAGTSLEDVIIAILSGVIQASVALLDVKDGGGQIVSSKNNQAGNPSVFHALDDEISISSITYKWNDSSTSLASNSTNLTRSNTGSDNDPVEVATQQPNDHNTDYTFTLATPTTVGGSTSDFEFDVSVHAHRQQRIAIQSVVEETSAPTTTVYAVMEHVLPVFLVPIISEYNAIPQGASAHIYNTVSAPWENLTANWEVYHGSTTTGIQSSGAGNHWIYLDQAQVEYIPSNGNLENISWQIDPITITAADVTALDDINGLIGSTPDNYAIFYQFFFPANHPQFDETSLGTITAIQNSQPLGQGTPFFSTVQTIDFNLKVPSIVAGAADAYDTSYNTFYVLAENALNDGANPIKLQF